MTVMVNGREMRLEFNEWGFLSRIEIHFPELSELTPEQREEVLARLQAEAVEIIRRFNGARNN